MNYKWEDSQKSCQIELLTPEEFQRLYAEKFPRSFKGNELEQIRFCKADRFYQRVSGTFAIPRKKDPSAEKIRFGYYLLEDTLIFIENNGEVRRILDEMQGYQMTDITSASLLLFDFMEYLIKDDMLYLQQYEEKLTQMEEMLLDGELKDFNRSLLEVRKDLSALSAYYEQLSDVGETLQQNAAELGDEQDKFLFGLYYERAERLYAMVQNLKEYSMQLREMHQTQIDIRQNEIMKILTVVTTIFMPLTLIAGWYGMNFKNMPELDAKYGYIVVSAICLAIVAVEVRIFRKKKWFE